jgi:hypothetical protein
MSWRREKMPVYALQKDVASGQQDAKSLFEPMMTFATGNELMLRMLQEDNNGATGNLGTTRVSTHTGWLKTDLPNGQGRLMAVIEFVGQLLQGISAEYCGQAQASILASPLLPNGQQSYVSSDLYGRLMHPNLVEATHQAWLKDLLDELTDQERKKTAAHQLVC